MNTNYEKKKTLGIIGGMGPAATADLFNKIVSMTAASKDSDHIRIIIDNNPQIPDRTAAILECGENPLPYMKESLRNLESSGAEILIIPCNTAHYFLDELKKNTQASFISMIEETASKCASLYPGKTAAILATKGTLDSGLYQNALARHGVKYVVPSEAQKDTLMDIIYNGVKAGDSLDKYIPGFIALMEELKSQSADYFIPACTELPIVFDYISHSPEYSGYDFSIINPTEVLAQAAIKACGYSVKS